VKKLVKEKSLNFETIQEKFNLYQLDDGSIIKVRINLIRIFETQEKDEKGNPKLNFDGEILSRVDGEFEPHEPSKDQTINEKDIINENISFKKIEEHIQVYYIAKFNQVLLLKVFPKKISLTSKYDGIGYPIYHFDGTTKLKIVKFPAD